MTDLIAFLELFGKGRFTCGAKFICFQPDGADDYIKIAQVPFGNEDQPEWTLFADAIVNHLNAAISAGDQT